MNNIIKNRYEFMFFIQAKDCNPNGDPDLGNLPRIDDEDMHGLITDVAIKRRIRDYVSKAFDYEYGHDIIMRQSTNVNRAIFECCEKADKENVDDVKKAKKSSDTTLAQKNACERFFDVRTFGGVLSTGRNAGQISGPVQFSFGRSVDPIYQKDISITRVCVAEGKENASIADFDKWDAETPEDKKRTIGRKQFIPYGLYIVRGFVSANLAEKSGFSDDDLNLLFEAILNMYNDTSASKNGMDVVGPIVIFKHEGTSSDENKKAREAKLGCAPAHMLFDIVTINKKEDVEYPRNYTDYNIHVDLNSVPAGVSVGFKYLPFENIVWDKPTDKWLSC